MIAEKTNAWTYSLPDGSNTPRQLTDAQGTITLSARYTPWGDTLETYGNGGFTFGYFGGVMDAATGLLYVGNGQYGVYPELVEGIPPQAGSSQEMQSRIIAIFRCHLTQTRSLHYWVCWRLLRPHPQFVDARLCTAQCHRILKLTRTIADLAGSEDIQSAHLAEARCTFVRPKIMLG